MSLHVDGLTVYYQSLRGDVRAVDGVTFDIADGEIMCKSTLMAILARMSAYTGQTITWEQALNSRENLSPPAYVWGPIEPAPLARPGVTQFV